jgi:hypothetical protein
MQFRTMLALTLLIPGAMTVAVLADAPPAGMAPQQGDATFRFATSVKTPKGTHSGTGTITIKRTGERALALTVQSDDGKPPRTISLTVGADGSISPDPTSVAAPASTDADAKAQAQAFMAEMTVAAHVGIGARKNGGAASYTVPVVLTPVGQGTTVSTQMTMTGSATQYTGRSVALTSTQLPAGGSLDPAEIAKTIGVTAFARHAFTPAGRVVTAMAMRHKRKEEKEAASGVLPDTVGLTVTADLADGKIKEIRGAQTDDIDLPGHPVKIESSWTFTKVPG